MDAGGTSITEPTHLFFGDIVGRVCDPLGDLWWIQPHVKDVPEEESARRRTDPVFAAAMDYVRGADFFGRRP